MSMKICVSLGMTKLSDALQEARELGEKADVIEIRLDLLDEPVVAQFFEEINVPLLFTNRAEWEGGGFQGSEEERLLPLLEAIDGKAAYVDLELRAPKKSWDQIRVRCADSQCRLIASWHDFHTTPEVAELEDVVKKMQGSGAHLGKIVTTAHDHRQALRVLNLQEKAAQLDFPLISFAMGDAGRITRAATCALGGYMTYCAPDHGEKTAPGQLRVSDLQLIASHLYR